MFFVTKITSELETRNLIEPVIFDAENTNNSSNRLHSDHITIFYFYDVGHNIHTLLIPRKKDTSKKECVTIKQINTRYLRSMIVPKKICKTCTYSFLLQVHMYTSLPLLSFITNHHAQTTLHQL
jgi:hypothetical protein